MNEFRSLLVKTMFLILSVVLFVGCSTGPNIRPDGCENSLIYNVADQMKMTPQAVGAIFQLANLELLKHDIVARKDVKKFLDSVDYLLNKNQTTYLDVMTVITTQVEQIQDQFGPEIIILFTAFAEQLSKPIPLDSCDRMLLQKHMLDQRKVLELVSN